MSNQPVVYYLTRDRSHNFKFRFIHAGSTIDVFCLDHPPLLGRDDNPHKTHIFADGRICFASGNAPRNLHRAKQLAAQWAEYFLEYRQSGIAQR